MPKMPMSDKDYAKQTSAWQNKLNPQLKKKAVPKGAGDSAGWSDMDEKAYQRNLAKMQKKMNPGID